MKKRKSILLVGITFALTIGCLNLTAKSECAKNLINESNQLVLEAIEIYQNRYLPFQLGDEALTSDQKHIFKFERHDAVRTPNEFCHDNDIFEHWRISIKNIYDDLGFEEKYALEGISKTNFEFSEAYNLLTGTSKSEDSDIKKTKKNARIKPIKVPSIANKTIKRLIVGSTAAAFSTMGSIIAGINSASLVPIVGWAIATALVATLVIFVVANWSHLRLGFDSFVESIKKTYSKIASLISKASNEAKKEAKNNPDVAEDATSPNQMQAQVKKGQAPKGVDRVDDAHDSFGQPHVHFKDKTALNRDGTIHDKKHGRPKPTRKEWDWLHRNGWSRNGIK